MFFVLCKVKWYCTIWISFQFNRLIYSNDIQRSESDGLSQWQSPLKLNHWHHLNTLNCTITQPWPLFFFLEQKQKKIKYFNTLQCSKTMIIKCIFNSNLKKTVMYMLAINATIKINMTSTYIRVSPFSIVDSNQGYFFLLNSSI